MKRKDYLDYLDRELEKIFIKQQEFTPDEEIIDCLNLVQELSLGVYVGDKHLERNLTFVLREIYEIKEEYLTGFLFTKKIIEGNKKGLLVTFDTGTLEDDVSIEEVRKIVKLKKSLPNVVILWYEYENGNWYTYYHYGITTIANDYREILCELINKIIGICGKETNE